MILPLSVAVTESQWQVRLGVSLPSGDKDTPRYVEPPMIQGHEFIGEVVKLGKGMHLYL